MKRCGRCNHLNSSNLSHCAVCHALLPLLEDKAPARQSPTRGHWGKKLFGAAVLGVVATSLINNEIVVIGEDKIEIRLPNASMPQSGSQATPSAISIDPIKVKPRLSLPTIIAPSKAVDVSGNAQPPSADSSGNSIFSQDKNWSNETGWQIYASVPMGACFAESKQVDGSVFVLGISGAEENLIMAYSGMKATRMSPTSELDLSLDGKQIRTVYVESVNRSGGSIVGGNFGPGKQFREEIASASTLKVVESGNILANISLHGTRKTFQELQKCWRAHFLETLNSTSTANGPFSEVLCSRKPRSGNILTQNVKLKKVGHKIKINNGSSGDTIINIRNAKSGKLVISFFVEESKVASITGVPDGEYKVQYATGTLMESKCRNFVNPFASEFDQRLSLFTKTEKTRTQITTTTHDMTFTLYPVIGGNAPTTHINGTAFNSE